MLWVILIGTVTLLAALLYWIRQEKVTQAKLRKLLKALIPALNSVGLNYWVDYGTLLGLYREGDIIRHDSDVDVCLYPRDENKLFAEKMISLMDLLGPGFELRYYPKDKGLNLFRVFHSGVYADLYETVLVDDSYVDISGSLPSDLLGSRNILEWSGLEIYVPENVPGTLSWRYGPDYMKPKRWVSNSN